uniref:AAA+ ATPase domain-containing protein n=3 Tax=Hordeum vulgare subsp. vulgare TaxID=112509 RepID=A0A8I7B961_HORVV
MAVSVVTGAINSVIDKLTGLLGDQVSSMLGKQVKLGIQYLRNELSSMKAVLLRLSDMEEHMDPHTKEWRDKVRNMSFEIEDCIDRFVQNRHNHGTSQGGLMKKAVGILKGIWDDLQISKEIEALKAMVAEESERRNRYNIDMCHPSPPPVPLDQGGLRAQYETARNLVGIDAPREKIFGWLMEQDPKPNVVVIFGIGGSGKTTLALEVYNKIQEPFDCRAFVSVSRTPNVKSLLKDILFQVNEKEYDKSEIWDLAQMILKIRNHLKDKRYLIVIDDIWSSSAWQHVKYALPIDNNKRSRMIATTRSKNVATACCADMDGHMYEAKLLSIDDSRSLFLGRIFPSNQCCPQDLREVADEILKKCGGLPLAIISIGSLLACKSRTVEVWLKIRKSVSSAVEKDSPIDQMKRILFLSYFDLPPHLKACLLYLSVFPEDYYIDSRFLIWKWMAEGLIHEENREDMEMLGESYLNELINRSMIQARKIGADGTTVKFCGVHDIVLDFITSQAAEDKFVTVLNDGKYPSKNIRWLSLHLNSSEAADLPIKDASLLRSLNIFGSSTVPRGKQLPRNCKALRVLNIEGVMKSKNHDIQHIGSFYQLKYLRITLDGKHTQRERPWDYRITGPRTAITELPEQIGNLHNLEVLDLRGCVIMKLPRTIVQLKKLVCLFLHGNSTPLPDEIGNLQCLEELSWINLCKASVRSIEGLGELTKLRALDITWISFGDGAFNDEDLMKVWASSLSKLLANSLRSLRFTQFKSSNFLDWWVFPSSSSPPPLRRLVLRGHIYFGFPTLPKQISSLINLTRLGISGVCEMGERGVNILASLPMLLSLTLRLRYGVQLGHAIGSQGFRCLVKFSLCAETCLKFEPGAMPKLQRLKLVLAKSDKYSPGGFVQGLLHLSSLKHISIGSSYFTIEHSEDWKDEIRKIISIHPNQPILDRI